MTSEGEGVISAHTIWYFPLLGLLSFLWATFAKKGLYFALKGVHLNSPVLSLSTPCCAQACEIVLSFYLSYCLFRFSHLHFYSGFAAGWQAHLVVGPAPLQYTAPPSQG